MKARWLALRAFWNHIDLRGRNTGLHQLADVRRSEIHTARAAQPKSPAHVQTYFITADANPRPDRGDDVAGIGAE